MCGPCVCYRFSHTCWWSGNSGQGRCHLLQAHQWGPDYWVGVPDGVWGLVMSKPGRLHGNRGQCQGAVTEAKFLHSDWGVNSGAVDALTLDTGQHHWGGGDESIGVRRDPISAVHSAPSPRPAPVDCVLTICQPPCQGDFTHPGNLASNSTLKSSSSYSMFHRRDLSSKEVKWHIQSHMVRGGDGTEATIFIPGFAFCLHVGLHGGSWGRGKSEEQEWPWEAGRACFVSMKPSVTAPWAG